MVWNMSENVWLDVTVLKCPHCGKLYADASWYVVVMESDIECSVCGGSFNTVKNVVDRFLLRIKVENGKVREVDVEEGLDEQ